MVDNLRYTAYEPEDGAPVVGVVYHIVREKEITRRLGLTPIGWVVPAPVEDVDLPIIEAESLED